MGFFSASLWNKIIRGIFMNNTQLVVRFNNDTLVWLEEHGYSNAQHLTTSNYSFPVIIVDTANKTFFGTNTTCMAAMRPKVLNIVK